MLFIFLAHIKKQRIPPLKHIFKSIWIGYPCLLYLKKTFLIRGYLCCGNIKPFVSDLVFYDGKGFSLHKNRFYGYILKNSKACKTIPADRGRNISCMSVIDINGTVIYEVRKGPYNSDYFINFINNNLISYFALNPLKILVMYNARFHHSHNVFQCLEITKFLLSFFRPTLLS
ncbi:hypothetical protein H311_00695 [Anncaliia algerae PRA109]|nr:hypothetical protein H311_00695 [Anncaliia algerae PRA109]